MNRTLDSTLNKHKRIITVDDYKENISKSHKICSDVIKDSKNRLKSQSQRPVMYEDAEYDNNYNSFQNLPQKVSYNINIYIFNFIINV